MTDKKISELTSNGTLNGSELVELVQSGGNVKALLSAVKTFITTGYLNLQRPQVHTKHNQGCQFI